MSVAVIRLELKACAYISVAVILLELKALHLHVSSCNTFRVKGLALTCQLL